jgi:hypothetical protein
VVGERGFEVDLLRMHTSEGMAPARAKDRLKGCGRTPPAGRAHPSAELTSMRTLRQDRLGGLIREYAEVA